MCRNIYRNKNISEDKLCAQGLKTWKHPNQKEITRLLPCDRRFRACKKTGKFYDSWKRNSDLCGPWSFLEGKHLRLQLGYLFSGHNFPRNYYWEFSYFLVTNEPWLIHIGHKNILREFKLKPQEHGKIVREMSRSDWRMSKEIK